MKFNYHGGNLTETNCPPHIQPPRYLLAVTNAGRSNHSMQLTEQAALSPATPWASRKHSSLCNVFKLSTQRAIQYLPQHYASFLCVEDFHKPLPAVVSWACMRGPNPS